MLTHVVMFKLNDPATDGPRLAAALNGLAGQIPGLQSVSAGVNEIPSDRAWDMALVTVFDDLEAMQAYQTHPAHVAAATEIRAAATQIAAVDFTS